MFRRSPSQLSLVRSFGFSSRTVPVKLLVDNNKRRVVAAEADRDFVDILFGLLTLPTGAIVRRLDKQSSLGCLDNLYRSVEKLDAKHLQTEACKAMLLRPQSAAAEQCDDLKLDVDDVKENNPRHVYTCGSNGKCCTVSSVKGCCCPYCRRAMRTRKVWSAKRDGGVWNEKGESDVGAFVRGVGRFMISDDLRVGPASVADTLAVRRMLDDTALEQVTLNLGPKEISGLIKSCVASKMSLSHMYFKNSELRKGSSVSEMPSDDLSFRMYLEGLVAGLELKDPAKPTDEPDQEIEGKKLKVKLLLNKANHTVVQAEVGEDFADLVFSFLTLPLGSVVKLLNADSTIGCIDNLYKSIQELSPGYFKSKESKSLLLSPKLPPFYNHSNQLLELDEMRPMVGKRWHGCRGCGWLHGRAWCHGPKQAPVDKMVNPKLPEGGAESVGRYVKGPLKFILTDDLVVSPISPISDVRTVGNMELVETEATIGRAQALKLLKAAVASKSPLTDVFSSDCWKRHARAHACRI